GASIVTVGDLSRPWLNLYIGERDLGKVSLGMKADVTVDSFPTEPFPGKVTFISDKAEFTPKNIQTQDERVKLVYRIKIEAENRGQALKPGMPADGTIPLNHAGADSKD
ncbi:MAG: HlyD family secretion protein, partial [Candidatus Eiseniibacteriota bacterium]